MFLHFLRVSGTAALTGEAVSGHHSEGRYYLTNNRAEVAYYRRRADALLENAKPLMEIYRADGASRLNAFLLADSRTPADGGVSYRRRHCIPRTPRFWRRCCKDTMCLRRIRSVSWPTPKAAGSRPKPSCGTMKWCWLCPD